MAKYCFCHNCGYFFENIPASKAKRLSKDEYIICENCGRKNLAIRPFTEHNPERRKTRGEIVGDDDKVSFGGERDENYRSREPRRRGYRRRRKESPVSRVISDIRWFMPYMTWREWLVVGIMIVAIFVFLFGGYAPVIGDDLARTGIGRTTNRIMSGPVEAAETIWSGINAVGTSLRKGAQSSQEAVYRLECRREAVSSQNIRYEKTNAYVESCACKKAGGTDCPSWKDAESETPTEEVNAENYLDIDIKAPVGDVLHLREICGSRCGRVEVTLENNGGKPIRIKDLYLELKRGGKRLPIVFNRDGRGQSTATYRISSYTDLKSPKRWRSIDNKEVVLSQSGEEESFTFLMNLTPRKGCVDDPDSDEEVGDCDVNMFAGLSATPEVTVEYGSITSTGFNLEVRNNQEMGSEDRDEFRSEYCESTGSAGLLQQLSSDMTDAVSLLMFTDCEIYYYPDNPKRNERIVRVIAKGDDSRIDSFKIDSISGMGDICEAGTGDNIPSSSHPRTLVDVGDVECDGKECETPTAACLKKIPPSAGTLNLGLEARYTAKITEGGNFQLQ